MNTSQDHAPEGETTTLTVRVAQAVKDQLTVVAKRQHRSKSFLAASAIKEYLSVQDWQDQRIRQALISADQDQGVDHDRVVAWIEVWDQEPEPNRPTA